MYNPKELQRRAQLNVMGVDNSAHTSLVGNAPQTKPYEFGRGLATIGDVAVNVLKGATKTLEGLFDAGAMLVGLFGVDVDDLVAYDWTSDVFGEDGAEGRHNWTWGEDLTNASLLKQDSFINQVAEGVGGMLPSVALALIPGVGTALSTASFIGGAGGSASEQALNEGNNYWQALGYGAIRGGIEGITEKIGGRVFGKATELSDTFLGKGLQKIGADKIFGSGVGKAVYNFTSEGLEEVVADALDIPTRMLTGMSNEENFNKDFKDYLGTFVTGGTVGVLLDGLQKGGSAIFNKTKGGSKYVKVAEDMKSLADNTKALALLQQNKKVSQDQLNKATKKLAERDLGLLEDMSKQFQNMTESQRQEAFTTLSVDAPMIVDMFETDGKLKETINQSYNEVISQNENYNVSSNLIGNTKDIQRNLDEINEEKGFDLQISNTQYEGIERENFAKISKAINGLSKKSGTTLNLVAIKDNNNANAFIRNNTIYVSDGRLKDGTWAKEVAHEVTHFTEKSKGFMDFGKFVLADENLKKSAIAQVLSKDQYGYTAEQIETAFNNLESNGKLDGKDLEIYQEVVAHATEDILGNEEAINKLARENKTWTQKLLNRIKDFLSALKGTNADTKTIERLTKAEELFEKALKQAGSDSRIKDFENAQLRASYLKDKQEYIGLAEEDKAKWLEEKGYIAEDFDSDVLDNSSEVRYSYKSKKVASYINNRLSVPTLSYLKNELKKIFDNEKNAIADGVAIEKDHTVYTVDAGIDNGIIDFGVRSEEIISDNNLRKEYIRRKNEDSIRKGYISDGLSSSFGDEYVDSWNEYKRYKSRKELSNDNGKSTNNKSGISQKDGDNGSEGLKFSYISTKDSEGNTLSKEQEEFFKDSKVRNDKGELEVVYHGTVGEFHTFDKTYLGMATGMSDAKLGFFFTNSKNVAFEYAINAHDTKFFNLAYKIANGDESILRKLSVLNGYKELAMTEDIKAFAKLEEKGERFEHDVLEVYLNIKNPLIDDWHGLTYKKAKMLKLVTRAITGNYDGVIIKNIDDSYDHDGQVSDVYIIFEPNQVKYITNKNPSTVNDMRFSYKTNSYEFEKENQNNLKNSSDSSKISTTSTDGRFNYLVTPSTLTEGEVAKKRVTSYSNPRIYEKSEAEKVVNDIIDSIEIEGKAVSLSGKTYREVVNGLWKSLNSQDGKDKVKTAQQIAKYIIEQSVAEDMLFEEENLPHYETIEMLKPYFHSFNLNGIKEEIANTYGKDNSVYALWSAGKNKGQTADDVAMELASMGYPINADSEWGAFQEIVNRYKEARNFLNRKRKQSLTDLYTLGQREELETQIVNAIVDKHYKNSAQLYETLRRFKNENKLMYEIAKVKDIKTFKNATVFLDPKVEAGIKIIKKLEWRGDVNSASIRNTVGELAKWYKPEENGFINENNYYNNFAEAMIDISNGEGNLTAQEVLDVANSVHLIRTILSHYSREFKNGKYVDALPSTKDKYQIMQENRGIQIGLGHKIFSGANKLVNWYFEKFCDNASIVRYMDRYNDNGFYTTIFEQLRRGTIDAEVTEMDIKKPQEEFIKSHKGFEKYVKNTTIKYENIEVPLEVAMAIYMTLKDEGSLERWAYGTNTFTDKDGKLKEIIGFAQDSEVTIDEIKQQAQKTLKSLESQFTDEVKDYIQLLEYTLLECKSYKKERDIKRLGVSNVKEGYYFPLINADAPAKNVDTPTMYEEIDRVSNKSFNKNRREHVKNGLYFNSATQTVNRHVKGIAQYYHLSTVIDNYNTLYNLNVSETKTPKNIKMAEKFYWANGSQFFKDLFADAQGVKNIKNNSFNKVLAFLRGAFAKFQLGFNPKVWATQTSSLFAATSIINPINLFKGLNKKANDIGNYCKLAELRYHDNSSALAEGVIDKVGKIGDVTMKPINLIDRKVNERLFIACQYQVEKQYNLKFGSIENKVKAGELLEKVILETQQNSLATEKSVAMRSDSEVAKSLTMFTSDAMKNTSRVIDCILKDKVLRVKLKNAKASNNIAEVNSLNKQIKANAGKGARSILALSVSAMYMAVIAQLFRWLLDKEEEDEDKLENMKVDFFGNMLGGLPIIKNLYSSVVEGYELEGITFQVVSDLFSGVEEAWDLIVKISKGDAEWDDVAKSFKTISFSAGQTLGIPTRNLYNYFVGLSKRFYPQFGYKVEGFFTDKNYNKKLSEAIKNNDTDLIETFVGIMMNDRIDGVSENVLKEFTRLMGIDTDENGKSDYNVLPTSVGNTITINDVQYSLEESTLKKDFKEVYSQANAEVDKLITSAKYQKLSDKAKAKAINTLYNYYYYKAQAEVLGVEQDKKIYLFSEIVPIDQLTYAIAYAQDIKDNKKITYKKELIQKYVQSLKLSATNKKFVMAYLGYKNTDSESLFKSVINRTSLTKAQKESLIKSCGY